MKEEKCQDCRYWEKLESGREGEGECRRYAPRGTGGGYATYAWNKTNLDDWCGDFDGKNNKTID